MVGDSCKAFEHALVGLDRLEVRRLFREVESREGLARAVEELVAPSLEHIGAAWEQGSLALSQVYVSSRFCEELLVEEGAATLLGRPGQPRIALGIYEDYHQLGKRMVLSVLRSSGYAVLDYGRVDEDTVCRRLADDRIQILLLSTLMLSSAVHVGGLIRRLRREGNPVKVVAGGAPFRLDPELWREVGCDAPGGNASEVIGIIRNLEGGLS